MKILKKLSLLFLFCLPLSAEFKHGLSFHYPLKYSKNQVFDYINREAPKGGVLRIGVVGTFDHLLPFASKGRMGEGDFLVYESLFKRALDEPFSLYGRLAEGMQISADKRVVTFKLKALFEPETVAAFFKRVIREGRYDWRRILKDVESIEAHGTEIVFSFKNLSHASALLMIASMPIGFKAEEGTGPYFVKSMIPGKRIVFERKQNYWGDARGIYNFNTIVYEYFKDRSVAIEALKAKHIDMLEEPDMLRLEQAYDFVKKGHDFIIKTLPKKKPLGAFGFVFNVRKPLFQNLYVRQALVHAFDFDAWNKTYYNGKLKRVTGYFMESPYAAPKRDDDFISHRADLHQCFNLLGLAGYKVYKHHLQHTQTQKPLTFELLLSTTDHHKLALYYQRLLERLGITMTIRTVDPASYERRRLTFDYDMILNTFEAASEPGEELLKYWGSKAAQTGGSYNYVGLQSAEVDGLIEKILETSDLQKYQALLQNLDGLLKKGYYMVPLYANDTEAVIVRKKIGMPHIAPTGYFSALRFWAPMTWWEKK